MTFHFQKIIKPFVKCYLSYENILILFKNINNNVKT
jgi:hypothetical protein